MAIRYTIFLLNILCVCFLITRTVSARLPNDDIAIIRQRVLELMIWPTDNNIAVTVRNALVYAQTLNSSCYWPDINYEDKNIVAWKTAEHMDRITTMLQALTVKGSPLHNDTQMRSAVHCALNVWLIHGWLNPNWWFNQINTPLQATSQLLMLGDNATDFEIEKLKEISFRADWWNSGDVTGANLVWMIQSQLYRSLATNNVTGTEQGFTRMWQDISVVPLGGQGIQQDWSYHFHGRQLLSGAYGESWAADIFAFVLCSNHTQYEPDAQKLTIFANLFNER
jgi:chondroitin AC lyase